MVITKEFLEAEIKNLRLQEQNAAATLQSARGAIQLAEFLLAKLEEPLDANDDKQL